MKIPERLHTPILIAFFVAATLALIFFMTWVIYYNR